MRKPKASFVIPVYNGMAFLAETLESCLKQSERNIEIVVVNDGSTDSTARLLNYFQGKDERICAIHLTENRGRCFARNYGIEAARADIIMTLDADDLAYTDRAKLTLREFKKDDKLDIVYGAFHVMDVLSNVEGAVEAHKFDWDKVITDGFTYICHSTMSFRKSVFKEVQYTEGEFDKHAIDDWKFQVDCYKRGFRFGHIPKVLGAYRIIPKARDEAKIRELKRQCLVG